MDDITVVVNNMNNVKVLADALNVYGKGSSAKVNWNESEVLWAGQNLGFYFIVTW